MNPSILLIGGAGVTGSAIAKLLRSRYPDLELIIAGRDIEKAQELASAIDARAMSLDLNAASACLQMTKPSAVAMLAKDSSLQGLGWAQDLGIPYIGISSAAFEHGVDLVHALARKQSAPVTIAGHWFAGAVTIGATELASNFESTHSITAGITIDRNATGGGPASAADFERVSHSTKATLARRDGAYVWESDSQNRHPFRSLGGEMVMGNGSVSIDVAAIGAATNAPNVRVLEHWGVSHHFLTSGSPADEISLEIEGMIDGQLRTQRMTLQLPNAAGSLTAISVTIALERMLGLDGRPPIQEGIYGPESLMASSEYVERLEQAGVKVERKPH
jgi:hypothetical protein